MRKLERKPLAWFKTKPQARKEFDEAELRQLGESLKVRQLQPVLARSDGTLVAGERRFRAAGLTGLDTLEVIISDEDLSESEIRLIQITENLKRKDLTDAEKTEAFEDLLRLNPSWTNKDLAAHLHISESMVTKYRSPSSASPEVREAFKAGKLGITTVYEISRVPTEKQPELLHLALNGTSRDGLADRIRKDRKRETPQVRIKRVVCPLPSGISITVAGAELSLDELIESLAEAQKEAKKAREQSLDVRTWQRVMHDKCRAQ
jgi:ParB family chromosome partitioning protein